MAAIEFSHVSKGFSHHTSRMLLRGHMSRLFAGKRTELRLVLRDVSFQVQHGESLAIVGRNGAGKSTILSLIAGLARPTSGQVLIDGRVAALLELGAGFHPDLTGAENLRLNASLLGFGRKKTEAAFDSIIDFAGLSDSIDEPLRTYSSGMIMRLAFSIAVMTDPDILLIDEVLAVGDQAFQTKSFGKILELRAQGKTIVCVSHVPGMVQKLCDRAIWIDEGEIVTDGSVEEVYDNYSGGRSLSSGV